VTRDGDASRPPVAHRLRCAVVTRSASKSRSRPLARRPRCRPVRERERGGRPRIDARQLLNRATSREAQTLAESERLAGEEPARALIEQLNDAQETLSDDLAELTSRSSTTTRSWSTYASNCHTRRGVALAGEREARVAEARQGSRRCGSERRGSDRPVATRGRVLEPPTLRAAAQRDRKRLRRSSERAERRVDVNHWSSTQVLDRLSRLVERSGDEIRVAKRRWIRPTGTVGGDARRPNARRVRREEKGRGETRS